MSLELSLNCSLAWMKLSESPEELAAGQFYKQCLSFQPNFLHAEPYINDLHNPLHQVRTLLLGPSWLIIKSFQLGNIRPAVI